MDNIIHTIYPEFPSNNEVTITMSTVSVVPLFVCSAGVDPGLAAKGIQRFLKNRDLEVRIRVVSSTGLGFAIFADDTDAQRALKEVKGGSATGLSVNILSREAWQVDYIYAHPQSIKLISCIG